MSWKIVIILAGDEPEDEAEVEQMEGRIAHALTDAGIEFDDLAVQ